MTMNVNVVFVYSYLLNDTLLFLFMETISERDTFFKLGSTFSGSSLLSEFKFIMN